MSSKKFIPINESTKKTVRFSSPSKILTYNFVQYPPLKRSTSAEDISTWENCSLYLRHHANELKGNTGKVFTPLTMKKNTEKIPIISSCASSTNDFITPQNRRPLPNSNPVINDRDYSCGKHCTMDSNSSSATSSNANVLRGDRSTCRARRSSFPDPYTSKSSINDKSSQCSQVSVANSTNKTGARKPMQVVKEEVYFAAEFACVRRGNGQTQEEYYSQMVYHNRQQVKQ